MPARRGLLGALAFLALLLIAAASASAETIEAQPNGKILVAGETPSGSTYVGRLLPDGSLDPSFGTEGVVLAREGRTIDLALQPDGGILALTEWGSILRLTPEGRLDPSFGTGGRARLGAIDKPAQILLMPDGRIAVGGDGQVKFIYEAMAEIFSADGRTREWVSGAGFSTFFGDMAAGEDGSLVMSVASQVSRVGLVRFVPPAGDYGEDFYGVLSITDFRGGYDKSFAGGAGLVNVRMPGDPTPSLGAGPLTPTQTGFVVAGASEGRMVALGFDGEGLLDTSFGRGGFTTIAGRAGVRAAARDVEPADGRTLVAGDLHPLRRRCDDCATPLLARLLPNGRLDRSFGDRGIARLHGVRGPQHGAWGERVVFLPDGRILIAGLADEASRRVVIGRFRADGSPDRSFGSDGVVGFKPCWGSERRQRRLGCLPSAEGNLQMRRTPSGVALRVEVRPVEGWAGVRSLALRLPKTLQVAPRQVRRARVSYVDYRRRDKRLAVKLEDGDLVFRHRGYEGLEDLTLEVPGGVLRWVGPERPTGLSFRLRVGLDAGSSFGGRQTLMLEDAAARPR